MPELAIALSVAACDWPTVVPTSEVVARTGDIVRVDIIGIEPGAWLVCGNVVGLSGGG
jgi:hypothetical protein